MSNFDNVSKLISYSGGGILSKQIFPTATLFCMAQGTKISEHTSTKNGIVYIVEGTGDFNLQGEIIKMEPGVIISMPENAVHKLAADTNLSFILLLG